MDLTPLRPLRLASLVSQRIFGLVSPATLLRPARELAVSGKMPSSAQSQWVRQEAAALVEADPAELYRRWTEVLLGPKAQLALQWVRDTGILALCFPELEATAKMGTSGGLHKDVWEHSKLVVWQAVPRPQVRWAALFHDIGKVDTKEVHPDGKVSFHRHAEVGRDLFVKGPAKRIAFPAEIKSKVEGMILHHLRPGQYEASWSDAAVSRFAREMGDLLDDLLNLSRADITSQRPGKRKACLYQISALARRIRELEAQKARPKCLPSGLGHAVMRHFALAPGPEVGVLLAKLRGEIEGKRVPMGLEIDDYLAVMETFAGKRDKAEA